MTNQIYKQLQTRISELERRQRQQFVRGVVAEIDHSKSKARVQYGENLVTGWLSFKPLRSGTATLWWPLELGEAVLVLSDGDLSQGVIFPGLHSVDQPAPSSDPDQFLIEFGNGDQIEHNRISGDLKIAVSGNADINIRGHCNTEVGGDLTAQVKGKAEVKAESIHLNGDDPIITQQSTCMLTGGPHCAPSPNVFASSAG